MTGLIMAAVLVDRSSLSVRLIAWAAAILLLIAPESLLGPSFQMSFAAATALIAVYEVLRRHFSRWDGEGSLARRPMIYIAGIGITTLVAGLATGPFALMHFGRFADFGLIANLLAVPLTALWVMPFGVISLVLMPFGGEVIGLVPMVWGLEGVAYIAETISNLPGAISLAPAMPTAALVAVALGGCWLCIWRQTGLRLLGIGAIMAGGIIWSTAERPDILINSDGKLIALRDEAGALSLSDDRESRFAAEMWLRRNAQKTALYWPGASKSKHANIGSTNMRCDALACSAEYKGNKIAFIRQPDALTEDCGVADIVVASVPIFQPCDGPSTVIDRFDLWRSGAHAVYLNSESGARIETVAQIRGARPWVLPPISAAKRKSKPADQP
jgi:competence protein ComEC